MKYLLVILLLLYSHAAMAQRMCGPRLHILEKLRQQYREHRIGIGLTATGEILELLVSNQGTYTILITNPNGRTCIVGTGEAWTVEVPKPKKGLRL